MDQLVRFGDRGYHQQSDLGRPLTSEVGTNRTWRDHVGDVMQTIEITDPLEARRCRYAQYRGEKVGMILNGVPVTGMIRSVKEDTMPVRAANGGLLPTPDRTGSHRLFRGDFWCCTAIHRARMKLVLGWHGRSKDAGFSGGRSCGRIASVRL